MSSKDLRKPVNMQIAGPHCHRWEFHQPNDSLGTCIFIRYLRIIPLGMQIILKKLTLRIPDIKQLLLHLIYENACHISVVFTQNFPFVLIISFSLKHFFQTYPAIASLSCWEISMPHLLILFGLPSEIIRHCNWLQFINQSRMLRSLGGKPGV